MPRTARLYLVGHPHHITQRGINRDSIFFDVEDYSFMLDSLKTGIEKSSSDLWAYCLMPNHFHLLVVPRIEEGMGKLLHYATFRYAQYFNKKYNRTGRLWQNRYYSSIVDFEEYLWAAVRYIETNPVRCGLVKTPDEWRWSSARFHIIGESRDMTLPTEWIPQSLKENYRNYLLEQADDNMIRKAVISGRPLGSDEFIRKLETILNRPIKSRPRGRPCKK